MGLFDLFKKKEVVKQPTQIIFDNKYSFKIAGMFAYENELKTVMGQNPKLAKARKIPDSKIFVLAPYDGPCSIIPEPTNKYDKNALRIVVNDHTIGYVPRDDQDEVKKRLRIGQRSTVVLLGGNYRKYENNEWVTYKNDIKGTVNIE